MSGTRLSLRLGVAYAVLSVFFLYFFSRSIQYKPISLMESLRNKEKLPDFSHYKKLRTLSNDQFPTDDDATGRVIVVGDIHGMDMYLHELLDKLLYNPTSDKLIHVGDLVTKGGRRHSLAVLSYMSQNNVTGVRGNQDQTVIEWRSWLDWITAQPDGARWLQSIEAEWKEAEAAGADLNAWHVQRKDEKDVDWLRKVPSGWKLFSEHYYIARDMSQEDYAYLLSLPLVLYVPSAHTYVVHAGLLSSNPSLPSHDKRQPLANPPRLPSRHVTGAAVASRERLMRRLQEENILEMIPHNKEPWVLLNMRGVKKDHSITRGLGGTTWAELWNADMKRCSGYNISASDRKDGPLPCLPSMVIYGHAAARKLDVNRWSIGLDSACAKGKRLSALVLGKHGLRSSNHDQLDDLRYQIPFGDEGRARIVSVKCR